MSINGEQLQGEGQGKSFLFIIFDILSCFQIPLTPLSLDSLYLYSIITCQHSFIRYA